MKTPKNFPKATSLYNGFHALAYFELKRGGEGGFQFWREIGFKKQPYGTNTVHLPITKDCNLNMTSNFSPFDNFMFS